MRVASRSFFQRSNRDAGFTLIELLVSLMLLAMIMALIPSTLLLGKRAWETAAKLDSGLESTTAVNFVEQRLAEAMPLFDRDADGALTIAFTGSTQALSFVAPLASGPLGGGLYRMYLGVQRGEDGGGAALALRLFPYQPQFSETAMIEERRLIDNLETVRFRYFGATPDSPAPHWSDTWARNDRLPDLVEMTLAARDGIAGSSNERPLRVELRLRRRE